MECFLVSFQMIYTSLNLTSFVKASFYIQFFCLSVFATFFLFEIQMFDSFSTFSIPTRFPCFLPPPPLRNIYTHVSDFLHYFFDRKPPQYITRRDMPSSERDRLLKWMCDREVRIYWEKSNGYLVEVNLVLNCLDVRKIIEWWPICESIEFLKLHHSNDSFRAFFLCNSLLSMPSSPTNLKLTSLVNQPHLLRFSLSIFSYKAYHFATTLFVSCVHSFRQTYFSSPCCPVQHTSFITSLSSLFNSFSFNTNSCKTDAKSLHSHKQRKQQHHQPIH